MNTLDGKGLDRRQFGRFMSLAGTAGVAAMTGGAPAMAQDAPTWKS